MTTVLEGRVSRVAAFLHLQFFTFLQIFMCFFIHIHKYRRKFTDKQTQIYIQADTHACRLCISSCAFMCEECLVDDVISRATHKHEWPLERSGKPASHFWRRRLSCKQPEEVVLLDLLPALSSPRGLPEVKALAPFPRDAHWRPLYSSRHVQQAATCIICGSGLSLSRAVREPRLVMRVRCLASHSRPLGWRAVLRARCFCELDLLKERHLESARSLYGITKPVAWIMKYY